MILNPPYTIRFTSNGIAFGSIIVGGTRSGFS